MTVNTSIDLLLHTRGGDIDAAEKLMSILRLRVGVGRLRVIVPDFAKSAGTLMAIGADSIVMSDTSELGPIDPQVTMTDGDGDRTQSVQAYLDAYAQLSERLQKDPNDITAQLLLNKFEPARIIHFEAVKARAREFAENQLKRMCREKGNYTSIGERLKLRLVHSGANGIEQRPPPFCDVALSVSERGHHVERETAPNLMADVFLWRIALQNTNSWSALRLGSPSSVESGWKT